MLAGIGSPEKSLEASDDGQNFRAIVKLAGRWRSRAHRFFPAGDGEVLPRRFQAHAASSFAFVGGRHWTPLPWGSRLARLRPTMKLPSWCCIRERGSTGSKRRPPSVPCPTSISSRPRLSLAADAVAKSDVIDLTAKMRADGTLDWTPPAGDWVVLRFGYSLLGITNHPATAEATGLEVDKLNRSLCEELHGHLPGQLQGDGGRGLSWASAASGT